MEKGMVCAPQPEAVEAGAVALKKGGNAVDAAITCALVQTVVDPMMCGPCWIWLDAAFSAEEELSWLH